MPPGRKSRETKPGAARGKPSAPPVVPELADRTYYTLGAGLVLLGLGLRMYRLGGPEVWLDEAFSWHIATRPRWFESLSVDNNPPLYYLLLRILLPVTGASEVGLRLLSALAGTAFVGLVIWSAREVGNRAAALWAGLVAAVAPIQIYYSQEARVYTLLDCLILLTWVLILRAMATNAWRAWALAGAAATAALYSHYLAVFALAPAAALVTLAREPGRLKRAVVAAAGVVALFTPWLIQAFVLSPRPAVGTSWIVATWSRTPKLTVIPLSLEMLLLGGEARRMVTHMHHFANIDFPAGLRLLATVTAIALGLMLAAGKGDDRLQAPHFRRNKVGLVVLLLAPLATLWALSWLRPIYIVGRYDMIAYPALPILAGLALAKLARTRGWPLAALAAIGLFVPIVAKLAYYYRSPDPSSSRPVAELIDAEAGNEDVLVFTGLRTLPILYYLAERGYRWDAGYCANPARGRRIYCRTYPRVTELTPAATNAERLLGSSEGAREELADYLGRFDADKGTLWLVIWGASLSKIQRADHTLITEIERVGFRRVERTGDVGHVLIRFQRGRMDGVSPPAA